MRKIALYNTDIEIYFHKTYEITDIINDICTHIISMNISNKQLKKISNNKTIVYCCSASKNVKAIKIQTHRKVYITKNYIYISSSNLSLSKFDEVTVRIKNSNINTSLFLL